MPIRHNRVSVTSSPPRAVQNCFRGFVERSCRSDSLGPCTCPWLRVSPSFRLLRAITKLVYTTFRGVYPTRRRRLLRRNLTSVTCQNVPPIVWEVGPGNEASKSTVLVSLAIQYARDYNILVQCNAQHCGRAGANSLGVYICACAVALAWWNV